MTKRRAGLDISAAAMDSDLLQRIAAVQQKHGIKPVSAAKENLHYVRRARERRRVLYARQNGAPIGAAQQRPPKPKRKPGMQDMGSIVAAIVSDVTGSDGES